MKKIICLVLFLCVNSIVLLADSESVYSLTTKEVEVASPTFRYKDIYNADSVVIERLDYAANSGDDADRRMAFAILKRFFSQLNMSKMQSMAISSRAFGWGDYESKAFIYTGEADSSPLFRVFGKTNRNFSNWDIIPENAFFAFSAFCNWDVCYDLIYKDLVQAQPDYEFAVQFFEMQTGMRVVDVMKAVSGEYIGFMSVSKKDDKVELHKVICIPDESGKLTKLLQELLCTTESVIELSKLAEVNGEIGQNQNLQSKLLIFDKGRVILANNAAAWEVVQNARNTKKNITMNPNWQKFNCRMRNNGLAKVFVSVNEADAEAIKSAMPNVEFYSLLPTVLVSEVFFTGQGYKIVVDGDRDWCDSGSIMELKAFFDNI